ncbi:MAG: hypothetical protein MUD08_14800 [Cytophagales bacterium]|nr:hypothetical protein [Cytophagales bacterium]
MLEIADKALTGREPGLFQSRLTVQDSTHGIAFFGAGNWRTFVTFQRMIVFWAKIEDAALGGIAQNGLHKDFDQEKVRGMNRHRQSVRGKAAVQPPQTSVLSNTADCGIFDFCPKRLTRIQTNDQ